MEETGVDVDNGATVPDTSKTHGTLRHPRLPCRSSCLPAQCPQPPTCRHISLLGHSDLPQSRHTRTRRQTLAELRLRRQNRRVGRRRAPRGPWFCYYEGQQMSRQVRSREEWTEAWVCGGWDLLAPLWSCSWDVTESAVVKSTTTSGLLRLGFCPWYRRGGRDSVGIPGRVGPVQEFDAATSR